MNFFRTIYSSLNDNLTSKNEYLRLVDFFLVFRSREVLLVSDQEADRLLDLTWRNPCDNFAMMNLTFARKRQNGQIKFQTGSTNKHFYVSEGILAALALFQGIVMYPKGKEYEGVKEVVHTTFAQDAASLFCKIRGLEYSYPRSDLEAICAPRGMD